jgi:hypothetical protein
VVVADRQHESRLYDRSAEPVFFGALNGLRSGELIIFWAMEFLGWNAKPVVGYHGTNDIVLAMERGEVDVSATSNMFQFDKLLATDRFHIIMQSGTIQGGRFRGRPELGDTPVLIDMMSDKLADPIARQAFLYWEAYMATDKWLGLIEGTPDDILAAYRTAFDQTMSDAESVARGAKISEDMAATSHEDMEFLVNQLVGATDEAADFLKTMQRKHGVNVE